MNYKKLFALVLLPVVIAISAIALAQETPKTPKDSCPVCHSTRVLNDVSQETRQVWTQKWGEDLWGKRYAFNQMDVPKSNILHGWDRAGEVIGRLHSVGSVRTGGPKGNVCLDCGNIYCKKSEVDTWAASIAEIRTSILAFNGPITCSECKGKGVQGYRDQTCGNCNGAGEITLPGK